MTWGLSIRQQGSKTLNHAEDHFCLPGALTDPSDIHVYVNVNADQKILMNAYYVQCGINW